MNGNDPIEQGPDYHTGCNNDDKCLDETLQIGYNQYKELKTKYKKACERGDTEFKFYGKDILTKYAKYMIEYIENKTNWHIN